MLIDILCLRRYAVVTWSLVLRTVQYHPNVSARHFSPMVNLSRFVCTVTVGALECNARRQSGRLPGVEVCVLVVNSCE